MADELPWPDNVWMGVSVEDATQLHRADDLRAIPPAVKILSCEPLLEPLNGLDLAGGESGPYHRPVGRAWVRGLRDRCAESNVAFFFKQWGGRTPKAGGRLLDDRIWDELPHAR